MHRHLIQSPLLWVLACLSLSVTAANFEIHGSNTIGAQLAPKLVGGFAQSTTPQIPTQQSHQQENESFIQGPDFQVKISAHGTDLGFVSLQKGHADIWAASRAVKPAEVLALAPHINLQDAGSEHVLAIDGLAILVHPSNPLNHLDISTLGKIFAGQIDNWSVLGGPDLPIERYVRDERSGTWETFKTLVLDTAQYRLHDSAIRFDSNDRLSEAVSQDPGGIGFTSLASVGEAKVLAIADGAVALKPTRLTVATEDYPLSRRLFLYSKGSQDSAQIRSFLDYSLSPQGQQLVEEAGFVSQTPVAITPQHDSSVPVSFQTMTQGYQRLSLNFRFQPGTRQTLDNKAIRDLQRLGEYLQQQERSGSDLVLIGFANAPDNGNALRAQMLSELRAKTVARALAKEVGIQVRAATGYGHYMPVGGSESPSGEQRNSRVEVWIRDHQ